MNNTVIRENCGERVCSDKNKEGFTKYKEGTLRKFQHMEWMNLFLWYRWHGL